MQKKKCFLPFFSRFNWKLFFFLFFLISKRFRGHRHCIASSHCRRNKWKKKFLHGSLVKKKRKKKISIWRFAIGDERWYLMYGRMNGWKAYIISILFFQFYDFMLHEISDKLFFFLLPFFLSLLLPFSLHLFL